MPSSAAERTARRTASTPRRWPSILGRPRRAAQRPLPSMMMATWTGILSVSSSGPIAAERLGSAPMAASCTLLHVHDLLFLGGEHGIDFRDGLVGRLLHLLLLAALLVLAHG